MKSKTGWSDYSDSYVGTDEFGFSALPGGYRYSGGSFDDVGYRGYWWTATESSSGHAYHRMTTTTASVNESYFTKESGFSARCVQD